MDLQFKENVMRGVFRPTLEAEKFETRLREILGLRHKYESARLSIGRSLAQHETLEPVADGVERGTEIHGQQVFGEEIDLWLAAMILDGRLGADATANNFR